MTEEEVTIKLTNHDNEVKSLKHRVDSLEEQNTTIQNLVLSVEKMAMTMQNMVETMKNHNIRLESIERKPADQWNSMQKTIFTTVISTLAGGIVGALVMLFK